MSCMFSTLAAVFEDFDFIGGVKFVFLGDVVEAATNRAFQTEELSGSFFSHIEGYFTTRRKLSQSGGQVR